MECWLKTKNTTRRFEKLGRPPSGIFSLIGFIGQPPPAHSDLILKDFNDLGIGDSEVSHGDGGVGVIEPLTEHFKTHSIVCPLDVAKGFSKGMGTIVAREIDGPRPRLDHAVDGLDGQRAVAA